MAICLPKEFVNTIREIVSNKSLSSAQRIQKMTDVFGNAKAAQDINLLYEKSLLLKNQEKAIDNFLSKIDGTSLEKRAKMREEFAKRQANRNDVINNSELLSIVKDSYDKKYGIDVSTEQVQQIAKIKSEADNLRPKAEGTPDGSPEKLAYGRKVVEMQSIIDGVINPQQDLSFLKTLGYELNKVGQRIGEQKTVLDKGIEVASTAADLVTSSLYKSINASADLSFLLRQGFKTLTSHPKIWAEQAKKALGFALDPSLLKGKAGRLRQEQMFNEFKANLVSSDLYEEAMASKLGIGVVEEFFPTPLADKLPVIGNVFKASDISFTMFAQGTRMSLFENMYKNYVKANGFKPSIEVTKDFAKVVNSISGRGNLGRFESISGPLNRLLFSAKFIKSQLDTFAMPFNRSLAPEARAEATRQSIATLGTVGALMVATSQFTDVEFDPRSSKFGKAKVPGSQDTWVDLTAGLGSYITLASRISTASTVDTKGKEIKLNSGKFGARTVFDVISDFATGKTAPAMSQIIAHLKGRYVSGEKPTVPQSFLNLITPISAENSVKMFMDEDSTVAMIASLADILGMSTINYEEFRKK